MKLIYTDDILKLFAQAKQGADRLRQPELSPEHLLLAIFIDCNYKYTRLLHNCHISEEVFRMRVILRLTRNGGRGYSGYGIPQDVTLISKTDCNKTLHCTITQAMGTMLTQANVEAKLLGLKDITEECLVLAMMKNEQSALFEIFSMYSLDYDRIKTMLKVENDNSGGPSRYAPTAITPQPQQQKAQNETSTQKATPLSNDDRFNPSEEFDNRANDTDDNEDDYDDNDGVFIAMNDDTKESQSSSNTATPTLDQFGYDMTNAAAEGLLDPVVGREVEIEHMIQALLRRKKNNPILIGEPGVGKTAVVEGLAQRIVAKQVCRTLVDKRIISLDLAGLVAGTKFRGEFEKRLTAIVSELRDNRNIIVFIDEIHTLVGTGNASGSLDAANILKPALARGEFQCIGSTTFDEYRAKIENDGALDRRFQKVIINPTSPDDTLTILRNIKDRYEKYHNVTYTDEALEMCVRLSERYVSDRNFPDKAIDALDEAGARAHIKNDSYPTECKELEQRLNNVLTLKKKAVETQDFEEAAIQREEQRKLESKLAKARSQWEESHKNVASVPVVAADIARVISSISGIPVEKAAATESDRLLELRSDISRCIIGQDEAVSKIVRTIQRSRIGLNDPNRPIGSFLFIGPTGVGKTLLARTIAHEVFLDDTGFIRLDMSEYSEQFAVSRLFGAPPGYVGYDKGGELSEQVRRHPYSVILFDEIEKAHPNIYNVLLQILDEGHMTDSLGRLINFKNTIIIMTSNVGSRRLKDFGAGIGFNNHTTEHLRQQTDSMMQKEIRKTFSPEFLNRIDDIIYFQHLEQHDIRRIVDLELEKVLGRVRSAGYRIEVNSAVRDFLATNGYDRDMGARPLRRVIQNYIEDEMCEALLRISQKDEDKAAYTIRVTMHEVPTDESAKTEATLKPCVSVEPNEQ